MAADGKLGTSWRRDARFAASGRSVITVVWLSVGLVVQATLALAQQAQPSPGPADPAGAGANGAGWQTKSTVSPANPSANPSAKPPVRRAATAGKEPVAPRPAPPSGQLPHAEPGEAGLGPGAVEAARAAVAGDAEKTTFSIELSKAVKAEIVTLANPFRVIIDMPNVVFRLPAGSGRTGTGLVTAFRYGLFAEGKARIVIDSTGPVVIERAEMKPVGATGGVKLLIELAPTDAQTFGAGTGAARAAAAAALAREQKPTLHDDTAAGPEQRAKPVVMIDPGHGGIDPGAVGGRTNVYEKAVVLAVAKQLRAVLEASGRYEVVMTRQSDVFVSLDQRLKLSRTHAPDLFISLHADSIDAKALTQSIRGASIYTLSERASDELARLMAEKENASDLIAGLETAEGEGHDQVRSILIDLLKRETANFSADFARLLVARLGKSVQMSRDPSRAAAFKVLKQPRSPSVLVELGYMSHAEDEKIMVSPDWQKRISASIGQAVDQYFGRRSAGQR